MEVFPCEICDLTFNDSSVLPKILSCGHTICSKCLESVISTNTSCPKCRSEISGTVDSHSTNFALLEVIAKKTTSADCHLICRAAILKNKLKLKKKDIEEKKKLVSSIYNSIHKNLEQVQLVLELPIDEDTDINLQSFRDTLNSIEAEYKNSEVAEFDLYNKWKSKISATINLKDIGSNEEYLNQVYRHVINGEAVFSMAIMGGRLNYGKVTSRDNQILFHSLDLSTIPESAITIWFWDTKYLSASEKIHCFLNISCGSKGVQRLVQIELVNTFEAMQFMKLCTGEDGVSYRDIKYTKGGGFKKCYTGILRFGCEFPLRECHNKYCVDYSFFHPSSNLVYKDILSNKMWVVGRPNHQVDIVNCQESYMYLYVIGTVLSPSNLADIVKFTEETMGSNKIIDCGLFIEI